jgi:hypothetical protein
MSKRSSKHSDAPPSPDAQRVAHAATGVVAAAEAALRDLEAQRAELLLRASEHDAERKRLAFAAFSMSDSEASRALSDMRDEAVRHDHELRDIDSAIETARQRLADAKHAFERVLDVQRREQISGEMQKLVEVGQRLDAALASFVAASRDALDIIDSINMLGRPNPSRESFAALGYRAILTKLSKTIWANRSRVMAPSERTSFTELADKWSATADNKQTDEVAA